MHSYLARKKDYFRQVQLIHNKLMQIALSAAMYYFSFAAKLQL